MADVEVLRFKTLDDDLKGSDNSRAVFHIVSGNEDDYFSVYTDPRTNEGVLMLKKVCQSRQPDAVSVFSVTVEYYLVSKTYNFGCNILRFEKLDVGALQKEIIK